MSRYRYILLVIAAVVTALGFRVVNDYGRHVDFQGMESEIEITRNHLSLISDHLHKYKEATGHYPTNDQGLQVLDKLAADCKELNWQGRKRYLRAAPSGLLSVFGDPYIYENRRSLPASRFTGSGATIDTGRQYSIRVDDGIYVWSIGAQQEYQTYLKWRFIAWLESAFLIMPLICLIMFGIVSWRRTQSAGSWLRRSGYFIVDFVGGIVAFAFVYMFSIACGVRSCYASSHLHYRSPELTQDYIKVMQKYNQRGVISDSAYQKILNALKKDKASEQ